MGGGPSVSAPLCLPSQAGQTCSPGPCWCSFSQCPGFLFFPLRRVERWTQNAQLIRVKIVGELSSLRGNIGKRMPTNHGPGRVFVFKVLVVPLPFPLGPSQVHPPLAG